MAGARGPPRHLVVVVHGLNSSPGSVVVLADEVVAALGRGGGGAGETLVHRSTANASFPLSLVTWDGVLAGGRRLADEIRGLTVATPSLRYLSLIGVSLGGLYCRVAAAGVLGSTPLAPLNFVTLASPHLGVRSHLAGVVEAVVRWGVTGVTGSHLLLSDTDGEGGVPLLAWMADPASPYHQALSRFGRRVLLANLENDDRVPYWSAALVDMPTTLAAHPAVVPLLPPPPPPPAAGDMGDPQPPRACLPLDTAAGAGIGTRAVAMEPFPHVHAVWQQRRGGDGGGVAGVAGGAGGVEAVAAPAEPVAAAAAAATAVPEPAAAAPPAVGAGAAWGTFDEAGGRSGPPPPDGVLEARMARSLRAMGGWVNVDVLFTEFLAFTLNHVRIACSARVPGVAATGRDVVAFMASHTLAPPPPPEVAAPPAAAVAAPPAAAVAPAPDTIPGKAPAEVIGATL